MSKRLDRLTYLLFGALLLPGIAGAAQDSDESAAPLRVMTQNLYVGGDFTRIVNALTQASEPVPVAVATTLQIINATNFTERAMAIASEIKRKQPDVVALQEVSLLRTQFPSDYMLGNPTKADTVLYDYLDLLMAALEAQGLHYQVASTVQEADVEAPAFIGFDPLGNPMLMDVRLTDRDVILTRKSVKTSHPQATNYSVNLQIPGPVGVIEFTRGYTSIDAEVRGKTYHIVNTHLETPGPGLISAIQSLQANELANKLMGESLPVVLLGDLNSVPTDVIDPVTGIVPPYQVLSLYGFSDAWLLAENTVPGYTCCQNETLGNTNSLLDQRIDHVMLYSASGDRFESAALKVKAEVIGNEVSDKTASGLWPSDHAGLAVTIRNRPEDMH